MQVLVLRLAPLTSAPLTDDTVTHEQSQGSETRERSTLTVVSRKQENEAMGVGTHGICTVIMLNLQGRETHGSKTRLVGLSKLCRTLGATIKTHGSVPRAHSCHSLFQIFSFVSCECSASQSSNSCLFSMLTLYWNNYFVVRPHAS